jgi:hypothetical protein
MPIIPRIAVEAVDDDRVADPLISLEKQLTKARDHFADIKQQYERSRRRSGELAEAMQTKLETEYGQHRDDIMKLERQLTTLKAIPPLAEVQKLITSLTGAALAGDVTSRARIAQALPQAVKRLTCRKDGSIRVELISHAVRRMTWTTTLD